MKAYTLCWSTYFTQYQLGANTGWGISVWNTHEEYMIECPNISTLVKSKDQNVELATLARDWNHYTGDIVTIRTKGGMNCFVDSRSIVRSQP